MILTEEELSEEDKCIVLMLPLDILELYGYIKMKFTRILKKLTKNLHLVR